MYFNTLLVYKATILLLMCGTHQLTNAMYSSNIPSAYDIRRLENDIWMKEYSIAMCIEKGPEKYAEKIKKEQAMLQQYHEKLYVLLQNKYINAIEAHTALKKELLFEEMRNEELAEELKAKKRHTAVFLIKE